MIKIPLFSILAFIGIGLAVGVFISLFFINAPYGRHARKGWGTTLNARLGWFIMELPSVALFAFFFFKGSVPKNIILILFFALWEMHYVHRALIYPLRLRNSKKQMPILIAFFGMLFNIANSSLNGYYLFLRSTPYTTAWLQNPRFLLGVVLFIAGFSINLWSDSILRSLRKPGDTGYSIPSGGLFRWVSCPNYLGEIVEWIGWALATWSLPGVFFAVWTISNLMPRARANHTWYKKEFPDYPEERKALIPGIW